MYEINSLLMATADLLFTRLKIPSDLCRLVSPQVLKRWGERARRGLLFLLVLLEGYGPQLQDPTDSPIHLED